MDSNILNEIINKIDELELEYQNSQGLILSEADLKCHIFRKIYSLFNHSENTLDNEIKASPLHSEIRFYDEENRLRIAPDITVIEPKNLSILHSVKYKISDLGISYNDAISGKQFEFSGDSYIIELKFCKNKYGLNKKHYNSYKKDLEKIKKLQQIIQQKTNGRSKVFGLFIVFNKTSIKPSYFNDLFLDELRLFKKYYSGHVEFQKNTNIFSF